MSQQLILRTLVAAASVMLLDVCSATTPRFLVVHDPSDPDQVEDIDAAIDAAQAVNGVVEFEAGKVYRTSEVQLWRDSGSTDSGNLMVAGIEGNGAMLKWPADVVPGSGKALLYLWAPQYKANSGCYIRNLTLDCGNNDIPTAANAGNSGAGLEGTGGTGQLIGTDEACDYGLRIYGGEDFLVENVTVLRAATTGVYVQTNSVYAVRNCVFRQVMARFGAGGGFRFANPSASGIQIENITLENCYSHRNMGMGFYFEQAANLRLVGCGAEKNNDTNVYVDSTVDGFHWFGRYTEKANYNQVSPPAPDPAPPANRNYVDSEGWIFESGAQNIKVLGGRLFGRFIYTTSSEYLIHSYGHTVHGFDGSNDAVNNTVSPPEANYSPTPEQLAAVLNLSPAYYEISDYFRYRVGMSVFGTTCSTKAAWKTALADKLNVHIVLHGTGDQTSAITSAVTAAVNASGAYSGTLAFEPGQTYETKPFVIDGRPGDSGIVDSTRGAIVGIRGNGALLRAISGGTQADSLVQIDRCYVSQDVENDYYGFFMSDLSIDAELKYDVGLELTDCKYFDIRNVDVCGARLRGIELDGRVIVEEGEDDDFNDIYYGILDRVNSHHNGSESSSLDATGIELQGSDKDGVRIANVCFYRSSFDFNTQHGIYLQKASVTFYDSTSNGNAVYGFRGGVMRSANLVNCRIAGGYNSSTEVRLMYASESYDNENAAGTLDGWAAGFHLLGGHVRDRYNREPDDGVIDYDDMNAPDGLIQSMVHSKNQSSLDTSLRASLNEGVADNDVVRGNSIPAEGSGS